MILSTTQKAILYDHLKQKIANTKWLNTCLDGDESGFPYKLTGKGKPKIDPYAYLPSQPPVHNPEQNNNEKPCYVITIPIAFKDIKNNPQHISQLLTLLKNESFGTTSEQSLARFAKRVAIVFGINMYQSIDKSKNEEFIDTISQLETIENTAYRVFGFFWKPIWENKTSETGLYSKKTAFRILKSIKPEMAEKVLEATEGNESMKASLRSQIPFTGIREAIKQDQRTRSLARYFDIHSPGSPIYFGTMDSDTKGLRTDKGLLSKIDKGIRTGPLPSVITAGYIVPENELPIIKLAVKIDMKVRAAMTEAFPYSAYIPEPAAFFKVRDSHEDHRLSQLSFASDSNTLENRRLIQNGIKSGLFDSVVKFLPRDGIITTTPDRFYSQKNRSVVNLTAKKLKEKPILQSLRGISQTHAICKQWADNVYIALNVKVPRVTDATTPMMQIFGIFDPITRMFNPLNRFTTNTFDHIMETYDNPLTAVQTQIVEESKQTLRNLRIPEAKITQVVNAARKSGEAIRNVLLEALEDLD